jgi:hypothetical protein
MIYSANSVLSAWLPQFRVDALLGLESIMDFYLGLPQN